MQTVQAILYTSFAYKHLNKQDIHINRLLKQIFTSEFLKMRHVTQIDCTHVGHHQRLNITVSLENNIIFYVLSTRPQITVQSHWQAYHSTSVLKQTTQSSISTGSHTFYCTIIIMLHFAFIINRFFNTIYLQFCTLIQLTGS